MEGAGGVVTITAECDRFLYNMMRLLVGTLVMAGLGRMSLADVRELLEARTRDNGTDERSHGASGGSASD